MKPSARTGARPLYCIIRSALAGLESHKRPLQPLAAHAIIKQSGMRLGKLWISTLGVLVCLLGLSSRPAPARTRVRPSRGREIRWQQHSDEEVRASLSVSPRISSNSPACGSRVVATAAVTAVSIPRLRAEDAGAPAVFRQGKPPVTVTVHCSKRPPPLF